jgi:hypothetical protein
MRLFNQLVLIIVDLMAWTLLPLSQPVGACGASEYLHIGSVPEGSTGPVPGGGH